MRTMKAERDKANAMIGLKKKGKTSHEKLMRKNIRHNNMSQAFAISHVYEITFDTSNQLLSIPTVLRLVVPSTR